MRHIRKLVAGTSLSLLLTVPPAWAVLGGSPGGVTVDHQPLVAPIHIIVASGYAVHELTTPDMVVREYVSPGGVVFAVAWMGRRSPDLPALFGGYFEQYETALASRTPKRSPMRGVTHTETPELVVETGGPMGSVWGKAHLSSQLPSGVAKEAIQ